MIGRMGTAIADSTTGLSTGAIVIAVVAGLIALGCLVWVVARMRGLEPRWASSLGHALAEAGYRTSEALAELADWVRIGR
jgi:hypothetical protein